MPRNVAKSSQKPPNRELYTPEPVRGRVMARHLGGQSNRQIAREEGIDRETVSRILSQKEVLEMMAEYQSSLIGLLPKAVQVFDKALDSEDLRVALGAATKLMAAVQVSYKSGIESTIDELDWVSMESRNEAESGVPS